MDSSEVFMIVQDLTKDTNMPPVSCENVPRKFARVATDTCALSLGGPRAALEEASGFCRQNVWHNTGTAQQIAAGEGSSKFLSTQNAHFIMADLLQKSLFQGLIGGVGVWGTEVGLQLGLCRDLAQRLQHRRQVLDPLARGLLVL